MNEADRLRIWHAVSAMVHASHPQTKDVVEAIRDRSWHPPGGEAAQALLLKALIGLPESELPFDLLARLAKAFLHPTRTRNAAPHAAMKLIEELPGFERKKVVDALLWIGRPDGVYRLAELPTTEAIREVASATGLLKGYRAYSFLEMLGLSAVAPEPCHRLLLQRLGMLPEGDEEDADSVFAALQGLALIAKVPVREVAFILAVFAGGRGVEALGAARCLEEPLCGDCPAAPMCRYAQVHGVGDQGGRAGAKAGHLGPSIANRSDAEVVAAALGIAADGLPPSVLALLAGPDQVHALHGLTMAQLLNSGDCPDELGVRLVAVGELLRRSRSFLPPPGREPIRSSKQIWDRYSARFRGLRHEELHVALLDTGLCIMREAVVSVGSLRECLAHPTEIFSEALRDKAYGIVMMHNHPSGSPTPSRKDVLLTSRISKAGKILGIPLLDHVVFGSASHFSFRESKLLGELESDDGAVWSDDEDGHFD